MNKLGGTGNVEEGNCYAGKNGWSQGLEDEISIIIT